MTIYITELLTGLLVIAGLFIWGGEGSVVELIVLAFRVLGALWMVATFIVVAGRFVRLVGEGKDLLNMLFGSILLWVIIGIMPVAVAKMAWRFVS